MILKALYDYYDRCGDLPPAGLADKEISFLIVIDAEGNFKELEDCQTANKQSGSKFWVVNGARTGETPRPYTFWDNAEYICNYTADGRDPKKVAERHSASLALFKSLSDANPGNSSLKAVCLFYEKDGLKRVYEDPLWNAVVKKAVNISFRIQGETHIVAEEDCLIPNLEEQSKDTATCLVTGEKAAVARLTDPTPIKGSKSCARLISFQKNSGYDSYGKSQGYNAPISKVAAAHCMTALNKLLDENSRNKFTIANRTFVFWASSKSEASNEIEKATSLFFSSWGPQPNPNAGINRVRDVFNSIYSGKIAGEADDRFYVLGLAPNAARIAVVYWQECELREFAGKIKRHFDDMEIVDTHLQGVHYCGIHQMMSAIALNGNASNVSPNLPESIIKSILQGIPYPYPLYMACMNRIRAEQNVTITRAAIIKAYLNRLNDNKNITIMLDNENLNQGYLCGRLFAVLEYIQSRSSGIKNSTIAERYMNSASTAPIAVFPTLLNLSFHHVAKLDDPSQIFFERIKSEIIGKISPNGFPARLDQQDQGRFMVGYYHQRQELYSRKSTE